MNERINKFEMVKRVKEKLQGERIFVMGKYKKQYTQGIIETVVNALLESVEEAVENGEKVAFREYFTIEPKVYSERKRIIPFADKEIVEPKHYRAKVNIGKRLKDACDNLTEKKFGKQTAAEEN